MASAGSSQPPMPTISSDSIKVIAETVGIANLKDEVAETLASDVEYRLRDIVQEALKFMKHGRRDTLSTDDINFALRLRNAEPLYGFASGDPPRFCRATGASDVFYLDDPEVNLADLVAEPLPKVPLEPSFTTHWLAVHGVQPAVPQNPTEDDVAAAASRKRRREDEGAAAPAEGDEEVQVVPLERHALTKEQQDWLDKVIAAVRASKSLGPLDAMPTTTYNTLGSALRSVAQDGGTHPLSPYLVKFIADEVNSNLRNLPMLSSLMRLLQAMLSSLSIDLEPYLHQVMPAVLTCVVGRRLCGSHVEDHWRLRHQAAHLVVQLLGRFGGKYKELQPRVTQTLLDALRNVSKPLTTHYGAVVGLQMLGPLVVHCLLLPTMPAYLEQLAKPLANEPSAKDDGAANGAASSANGVAAAGTKAHLKALVQAGTLKLEALRVHGALLHMCAVYYFRHGACRAPSLPPHHPTHRDAARENLACLGVLCVVPDASSPRRQANSLPMAARRRPPPRRPPTRPRRASPAPPQRAPPPPRSVQARAPPTSAQARGSGRRLQARVRSYCRSLRCTTTRFTVSLARASCHTCDWRPRPPAPLGPGPVGTFSPPSSEL